MRSVNLGFHLGVTPSQARRKRRQFLESYGERAVVQEIGMLFGTPSEVVARVGEYVRAGAQGLNIVVRAPFDLEALQAFIEEVIPVYSQSES